MAIDAEASIEPATMAKILDAQAEDEDGLVLVVDELADLGAMSLLECISTNPSSEFKVEAAATKSIVRATNNGAVEVTSITQGQMSGIVSNMRRAQLAKSEKADHNRVFISSGQSAEVGGDTAASLLVDNTMDLLALVTKDEGQAISISDSGGLEQLVAVLIQKSQQVSKRKSGGSTEKHGEA